MEKTTFSEYTTEARSKFVGYINKLEWDTKLRTECEDLLIAYDQMKGKCDELEAEANKKFCVCIEYENCGVDVNGDCITCGKKFYPTL